MCGVTLDWVELKININIYIIGSLVTIGIAVKMSENRFKRFERRNYDKLVKKMGKIRVEKNRRIRDETDISY